MRCITRTHRRRSLAARHCRMTQPQNGIRQLRGLGRRNDVTAVAIALQEEETRSG